MATTSATSHRWLHPLQARLRSRTIGLTAIAGLALVAAAAPISASAATYQDCSAATPNPAGTPPCLFHNFEMDGNPAVDGGGDDWAANPYPVDTFVDATPDNSFKQGSKYLDQPNWTCDTHPVTPKDNLLTGALSEHTFGSGNTAQDVLFFNFNRQSGNGDTFIDFAISKGAPPASATCFTLPARAVGDVVITITLTNGGNTIGLLMNRWNGTGFDVIPNPPLGSGYQVALSADGTFGEGGIDLTSTGIGVIDCDHNANAYMDSRSAGSGSPSEMKDYISGQPVAHCETPTNPSSSLTKGERDVTHPDLTKNGGDFTLGPITASAGDVLEYQLGYLNSGTGSATSVVVTDVVPTVHATYVAGSCTPACTYDAGTHTLTWNLGTIAASGTATMTFQVQLDAAFPVGTTTVSNAAVVDTAEEQPVNSNQVDATVTVAAPPPSPSPAAGQEPVSTVNLPVAGAGPQERWGLVLLIMVVLGGLAAVGTLELKSRWTQR